MKPLAAGARARRWCVIVLAAVAAALALVGVVNAVVDPFQQYRLSSAHAPRFYALHHRWINPGIAKHARYDTVLIGSSIMESTPNDVVASRCGGPAVNLSMPAISAAEIRIMLETVFRARTPRRVVVVLDFNAFAGAPDARQDSAGPMPAYLYDRNPLNDLPYVLSGTVLRKSVSILTDRADEPYRSDANAPWFWADRMTFGKSEVLRGLDPANINARFAQPTRTIAGMRASFERNIAPVLRAHPDTHFDLVWPPYSILVWVDFAQRHQLDVTLAFKRYVVDAVRTLGNVDVVDLQAHPEITTDLDRYMDIYHFGAAVNRWIIERACTGLDRVDAVTAGSAESQLRAQLSAWQLPGN
ncbi:MAG: hypothetical protein ABI533_09800 [Betaproteobacteria bacterium]